jgi:hypothetical protein
MARHGWPTSVPRPSSDDADEAGDYRVMKHSEAVNDPQWEIADIDPNDLD